MLADCFTAMSSVVCHCLRLVWLGVVQSSTVYIHVNSSAQFYNQPYPHSPHSPHFPLFLIFQREVEWKVDSQVVWVFLGFGCVSENLPGCVFGGLSASVFWVCVLDLCGGVFFDVFFGVWLDVFVACILRM